MPRFVYSAKNTNGEVIQDIIEADSRKAATLIIQNMGYFPISVKLEPETSSHISSRKFHTGILRKVKRSNVTVFTRQLSDLLKGGLPLARSLAILARQTENIKFCEIIKSLNSDVREGSSFSDALCRHPHVFSKLYIGMIRAGEAGGMLESIMERLSEFAEREQRLRSRIKSALTYPAAMLVIGTVTVIFLVAFIIPRFTVMFHDVGGTLPLPTLFLIWISEFLQYWWWIYIPASFLGLSIIYKYIKSVPGRLLFDKTKLRIPVIGRIFREELVSRFTITLGTLLKNGVVILTALDMVKDTIGNDFVCVEIQKIHKDVSEGKGLVEPLKASTVFPPIVAEMVSVGQETGNLDDILIRISDTYNWRVENALKALTSLLEPLIILIMAVLVGFVVLAMLLPVFEISSAIR